MKRFGMVTSICFLVTANTSLSANFIDCTHDKNVVIWKSLEGSWKIDPDLTESLGSESPRNFDTIEFSSDLSVVERIKAIFPLEEDTCFYFAGTFTSRGPQEREVKGALLHVNHKGTPVLIAVTKSDRHGDTFQGVFVMLALGQTPVKDILFLGGFLLRHPMRAFRRQ